MRYQVTGSITFEFDTEVEADSEEDAAESVAENGFAQLIENAPMPTVEIEDCLPIPAKPGRRKPGRKAE